MLHKFKYNYSMHVQFSFVNFALLLVLVRSVPISYYKAPDLHVDIGNNSLASVEPELHPHHAKIRIGGCRYQASVFSSGDLVPIEEPCLNCQCKNTAVVCKLRICSDVQIPPAGCILVHKAKKCCAQIVCPDSTKKISREHRLASGDISNLTMNSLALPDDKGFCVFEGTVYAEGSAMRSSSLCEYCFCIRGDMKCSSPQCVIPLEGCKPKFRSYACCPTNYDCNDSNSTAIVKTVLKSTPLPQYLKGCQVSGRFVHEGEPVLPLNLEPDKDYVNCQTCFCMGGVVRCRQLECDKPIHGCRPIIKTGHCCPDRYECPMNATAAAHSSLDVNILATAVAPVQVDKATESITVDEILSPPLPLNHISVNEILTSRIAQSNLKSVTIGPAELSQVKPVVSELGSREERRNKDKDDYVLLKVSHEEDDKEDSSTSFLASDIIADLPHQALDLDVEVSTSTPVDLTTLTTPQSPEEGRIDGISELLTSDNNEPDGEELTIALEVITENDLTEATTPTHSTSAIQISTEMPEITSLPGSTKPERSTPYQPVSEPETTTEPTPPNSNTETPIPSSNEPGNFSTVHEEVNDELKMTTPNPNTAEKVVETEVSKPDDSSFTNLHFIPFGVEDAMILEEQHGANDVVAAPIKIIFDSTDDRKASLIAPSPPKSSYTKILLMHQQQQQQKLENFQESDRIENPIMMSTDKISDNDDEEFSKIITSASIPKNEPKNTMFDVQVSTSLYNNGYFPNGMRAPTYQNKSIFDHIFEDSRLDEDDEEGKPGLANGTLIQHVDVELVKQLVLAEVELGNNTEKYVEPVHNFSQLPSRIYSKFDIHDSPYYHQFGESGYELVSIPKKNKVVPVDHHRYYEGPELTKDVVGFYPFADYGTSENDEGDELLLYEDDSIQNSPEVVPVDYKEPSFSSKLEKMSLASSTTSISPPSSTSSPTSTRIPLSTSSTTMRSTISPRKPQYFSKTSLSSSSTTISPHPALLFSPSSGTGGFKPVVSFPFIPFPKNRPLDALLHIGLKLSGCNIYGKMYGIGNTIRELSSSCVQCQCTEIGVQCTELHCTETESMS